MHRSLLLMFGTAAVALGCTGSGIISAAGPVAISPADKATVYTAAALSKEHQRFQLTPSKEEWSLNRTSGGSYLLSYDYTDLNSTDTLVIGATAFYGIDEAAADAAWLGAERNVRPELAKGLDKVEANQLLNWGDRSECSILETEGTAMGNLCLFQKGQRIGYILTLGAAWTEPDEATASMAQSLKAFEEWTPTQLPVQ